MKRKGLGTGLVSCVALSVLLAGRLPIMDPSLLHGIPSPASIPPWAQALVGAHDLLQYVYGHAALLVLAIVLLIHRDNLGRLNIDGAFLFLFIWATLAFSIANPGPVGWAGAVLAVCIPLLPRGHDPGSGRNPRGRLRAITGILIAFGLCLIWVRSILDSDMIRSAIHWILIDFPPNVVTEELLFRGLLWMFLKNLGRADGPVVVLQATLFWLAHAHYLFTDPAGFWVIVPVLSIALGICAWKTRSITTSTIAHIGMNVCWSLFLYAAV